MKKRSLVFISFLSGLLMTLSWINVMSLGFLAHCFYSVVVCGGLYR